MLRLATGALRTGWAAWSSDWAMARSSSDSTSSSGRSGFSGGFTRGNARTSPSNETATAVAHQVHGAIGFTREHDLRHFTQRLLAWRSEFGSDRQWSEALGHAVIERGVDTFWSDLTARGDAAALEAA